MPLPLAHSLAGISVSLLGRKTLSRNSYIHFGSVVLLSNLADFDFLPGLILGEPNVFHSTYSHTLGTAVLIGVLFSCFYATQNLRSRVSFAVYTASIYYSHVILDFFNEDTRYPFGVMLAWPFSDVYFHSSHHIFMATPRSSESHNFFQSMLTCEHLHSLIIQGVYVLPVLIGVLLWRACILPPRGKKPIQQER